MNPSKSSIIIIFAVSSFIFAQEETIGDIGKASPETVEKTSESQAKATTSSSAATNEYHGFRNGTQFLNIGLFYGSALVGVDYEYGFNKVFGIQAGGGLLGADAGVNIHFLPKKHVDMYVCIDANYMPGYAVVPGINLGMRGLFGKSARVGVGGELGFMIGTAEKTFSFGGTTVHYTPGEILINFALGVPVRIH